MKKHLTKAGKGWKVIEDMVQEEGKGGLIAEYLYFKMLNHEEPLRKGTPKGEKIGFTGKKYFASIKVGITNWKLKDIAKKSDVSYGLLRKWRTESDFQAEVENHCSEFVTEIIKRIKTQSKKQNKALEDFFDGNGADPSRKDLESPLDAAERVMIDAHLFSEKVLNRLAEAAQTIIEEGKEKEGDEFALHYRLFKKICDVITYAKSKDFTFHHPLVTKLLVAEVKAMVSPKKTLSEKEQKIAMYNLTTIENELDLIYKFFKKT